MNRTEGTDQRNTEQLYEKNVLRCLFSLLSYEIGTCHIL